ncbi:hypothetical protein MC7420_2104 [Coleofasciculus chthonoplastes PCC 7420]|jgi:hypothetical protein|uniref:Uncharacterized protein n=1 Tax=Coleofasciculus chthonoplastes PCC 7420 TaxID=118168 RepID=B4VSP6_9CYAN|nr:hypothetical protein [Coleofasciculus chthonoplastes]EDX75100.1 hypothetical protein MC7420_2104 [Coleofasciculus chthonoplastes PCC 7420]
MNALGPRFWKLAYRKEPISSFIVTVGAVDAVIGGVGERWSLLTFGLMMVMLALCLRWWQSQRRQTELAEQPVTHYLPSSPSRPPLPMLSTSKRHPHR